MRTLLISLLLVTSAVAHTDISTTIKNLSAKIAEKPTAKLYYQRATEYRALREKKHAIEDLRAALALDQKHRPSRITLIDELGKSDEALLIATQLFKEAQGLSNGVESAYLVANVYFLRGSFTDSLKICEQLQNTVTKHSTDIDLLHAENLFSLKRPDKAATVLKNAWERTNSIVLRNNWIDTALTAGQTKEILPIIEKELHSSRLRSSWLIRRARALLILDKKEAALIDLRSALLEINPRINPAQPDLTLIADRGLTLALMGNLALAKRDLNTLEKSSLPASSYRLLKTQLTKDK